MQTSTIMKGAAIGIAAGCVTCLVANSNSKKSRIKSKAMKKKAEQAFKTVGTVMDEIAEMVG